MLKNKKSSKKNFNFFSFFTGYNIFIFILFLISSSFVISIIDRHLRFGIKMDYNFSNTPPDLIIDPIKEYENSAFKDIRVEVLNGCGIKGIAAKTSEFLRSKHRIDVIRSDNADRYDYSKTIIIGRNEDLKKILSISNAFDISINNVNHIQHIPDETLGVDVTIILGKDINSFTHISEYISQSK